MKKTPFLFVTILFLSLNVFGSEFTEKQPELSKKVDAIKEKEKTEIKGKLTDLIKEISALKFNAEDEDEPLMYYSYLGELCTINGDYAKSNEFYSKLVEKVPHATFYRLMVVNMILKGDKEAANKLVETFTKKAEDIKDVEDRKRQIGHVKSALEETKVPAK